jgi:hypothetical protein
MVLPSDRKTKRRALAGLSPTGATGLEPATPVLEVCGSRSNTNRLQCVDCGRVSREGERDWTARLTLDDEVAVNCPKCDEREFGC